VDSTRRSLVALLVASMLIASTAAAQPAPDNDGHAVSSPVSHSRLAT
jgi:hypothetical protein